MANHIFISDIFGPSSSGHMNTGINNFKMIAAYTDRS